MSTQQTIPKKQPTRARLTNTIQQRTAQLLRSNQQLQLEIAKRKSTEQAIIDITQKEQRRFGAQLHDGVCQEMAGILLLTKALTQAINKTHAGHLAELARISTLLHTAIENTRETARELYPGELRGDSLVHSLEELATRTEHALHISCKLTCPVPIHINDVNLATQLYRIAQEGIGNAVRHGRAQSIRLRLTQHNERLKLTIRDNGIGFADKAVAPKGIGLDIIGYRAHLIGAKFQISANTPKGVTLTCTVPLMTTNMPMEAA